MVCKQQNACSNGTIVHTAELMGGRKVDQPGEVPGPKEVARMGMKEKEKESVMA